MSTERETTRVVRSWLEQGVTALPDRVLDDVLGQLPATPQRRPLWRARRFPFMNSPIRYAIAAVAAVVVALVGAQFLPSNHPGPGNPSAAPSRQATEAPTASPAATVTPMPPEGIGLSPGRYSIRVPDSDVRAVVRVEEGWTSGVYFIMNPPEFTKQVSFWNVANVYDDICDPGTGGLPTASQLPSPAVGPTVADLVTALDAQVNTDMSTAVDVTVGGYAGKRVTMVISTPYAHCIGDQDPRPMWVNAEGRPQRALQPGDPDTIWILDVAGRRVVIVSNDDESEESKASIAAVIGAIAFEVP